MLWRYDATVRIFGGLYGGCDDAEHGIVTVLFLLCESAQNQREKEQIGRICNMLIQ